jgi:hypothetical protein
MEPEGMVKAWTTSVRMTRASAMAMTMASPYSRISDLRRAFAPIVSAAASSPAGVPVTGTGTLAASKSAFRSSISFGGP